MEAILEHLRKEIVGTHAGTGTNGGNTLLALTQAYTIALRTAADMELMKMEAAARFGFADAPALEVVENNPRNLNVVR